MNAPYIWILFPLGVVPLLLFFQNRRRLVAVTASLMCGILALLAWQLPLVENIQVGSWYFKVETTWSVLGRTFTLDSGDQAFLIMIYMFAALWFLGSLMVFVDSVFVPLGLGIVVTLVAALSVEPFLYAALLIEIAVLLSIPMLSPPGKPIPQGALRYLIFQTLAMPFILFAGWMLTGVGANPGDPNLVIRVEVLLGMGFAFLLAVFPFYTWIPMLCEQVNPYVTGFILTLMQTVTLLFGLNFIDRYAWLRTTPDLVSALQLTGTLMVVTGGIWAAFQNHLGRILGYAIILETGFALLALAQINTLGLQQFSMLFLPRLLAIGLWSLSLSLLKEKVGSLDLLSVQGTGRLYPFVAGCIVLVNFSVAGLPLLADFPVKQAVLSGLAGNSTSIALWVLMGSFGLVAAGLRTLAAFASQGSTTLSRISPTILNNIVLGSGSFMLFLIGIFPQIFLPGLLNLLKSFTHLIE